MTRVTNAVSAVALVALLGCGGDTITATQVLVRVDAQAQVRARMRDVRLVVRSGQGETGKWEDRYDKELSGDTQALSWPIELSLLPKNDDATRVYEMTATALDANGKEIAQVRAISGFVAHKAVTLALRLDDACISKTAACDEDETCRAGECVDAHVDAKSLPGYVPGTGTVGSRDAGTLGPLDEGGMGGAVDGGDRANDPGTDGASDGAGRDAGDDAGTSSGGSGGHGGTGGGGSAASDGGGAGDPCSTDNGGCDPRASCSSDGATPVCGACPSGYTDANADGTSCVDVDECSGGAVAACGTGASDCTNTDGTYACTCASGYEGTGGTACVSKCPPNAVCWESTAYPGEYYCLPSPGSGCPSGSTVANSNGVMACVPIPCSESGATCAAGAVCGESLRHPGDALSCRMVPNGTATPCPPGATPATDPADSSQMACYAEYLGTSCP